MNKRLPGYMTVAAGFVPLACKMPYMFRAWRQSPLDRFDWIFGALFLEPAPGTPRKARRGGAGRPAAVAGSIPAGAESG